MVSSSILPHFFPSPGKAAFYPAKIKVFFECCTIKTASSGFLLISMQQAQVSSVLFPAFFVFADPKDTKETLKETLTMQQADLFFRGVFSLLVSALFPVQTRYCGGAKMQSAEPDRQSRK